MFWIEKKGYCTTCGSIVEEKAVCKYYKLYDEEKTVTVQMLETAMDDIKELQKIYGE